MSTERKVTFWNVRNEEAISLISVGSLVITLCFAGY
ncbi:hypothetical protein SAMN04515695_0439 [Pseudovibrio sp. Tun.PSC04-5.I4]|nr:hypothetical protein SAMN04515695_0439 [Pseudovibrio sp. Tun.PSC04-5.I4]